MFNNKQGQENNQEFVKTKEQWLKEINLEKRLELLNSKPLQTPSQMRYEDKEMEETRLIREGNFQSPGTFEEISAAKMRELSGIAQRKSKDFLNSIHSSGKVVWMKRLYNIFKNHGYYNRIKKIALSLLAIQEPLGTEIQQDRDSILRKFNELLDQDSGIYNLRVLGENLEQFDESAYQKEALLHLQNEIQSILNKYKKLEKKPNYQADKKPGLWFRNTSIKNIIKEMYQYQEQGFFDENDIEVEIDKLEMKVLKEKESIEHLNKELESKKASIKEVKRKIKVRKKQENLFQLETELENLTTVKNQLIALNNVIQALEAQQKQEQVESIQNEIDQKQIEKSEVENTIKRFQSEDRLKLKIELLKKDIQKNKEPRRGLFSEMIRKMEVEKKQENLFQLETELENLTTVKNQLIALNNVIQALEAQQKQEAESIQNEIDQKQIEKSEVENTIKRFQSEDRLKLKIELLKEDIQNIGSLEEARYDIAVLEQERKTISQRIKALNKDKNIKENILEAKLEDLKRIKIPSIKNTEFKQDIVLMGTIIIVMEMHHEELQHIHNLIKEHLLEQEIKNVDEGIFNLYADQEYLIREQESLNQHINLLENELLGAIDEDERLPIKNQAEKLAQYIDVLIGKLPVEDIRNVLLDSKNRLSTFLNDIDEQGQKDKDLINEVQEFCRGFNITVDQLEVYLNSCIEARAAQENNQEANQEVNQVEKLLALQDKLALVNLLTEKKNLEITLPSDIEDTRVAREEIFRRIELIETQINEQEVKVNDQNQIFLVCGECDTKEQIQDLISNIQRQMFPIEEGKQQLEKLSQWPNKRKEKRQKDIDDTLINRLNEVQVLHDAVMEKYESQKVELNRNLRDVQDNNKHDIDAQDSILYNIREINNKMREEIEKLNNNKQSIEENFNKEQELNKEGKGTALKKFIFSRLAKFNALIKDRGFIEKLESVKEEYMKKYQETFLRYEQKVEKLELFIQNNKIIDVPEKIDGSFLYEPRNEDGIIKAKKEPGSQRAYLDQLNVQKYKDKSWQEEQQKIKNKLKKYKRKILAIKQQEELYQRFIDKYNIEEMRGWFYVPFQHRLAIESWLDALKGFLDTYKNWVENFEVSMEADIIYKNCSYFEMINRYLKEEFLQRDTDMLLLQKEILELFAEGNTLYRSAKTDYGSKKYLIKIHESQQKLFEKKRQKNLIFQDGAVLEKLIIESQITIKKEKAELENFESFKSVALVTNTIREKLGLNELSKQIQDFRTLSNELKNEMRKQEEKVKRGFQIKLREYCEKVCEYTDDDLDVIRYQVSGLEVIASCFTKNFSLDNLCKNWLKAFENFHAKVKQNLPESEREILDLFFSELKNMANEKFRTFTLKGKDIWMSLMQQHKICQSTYESVANKLSVLKCFESDILSLEYGKKYLTGFKHELESINKKLSLNIDLNPSVFLTRNSEFLIIQAAQNILNSDDSCFGYHAIVNKDYIVEKKALIANEEFENSHVNNKSPSAVALYDKSSVEYFGDILSRERSLEILSFSRQMSERRSVLDAIQDDKEYVRTQLLKKIECLTETCFEELDEYYENLEQQTHNNYLSFKC